jgi:hypothetical protein
MVLGDVGPSTTSPLLDRVGRCCVQSVHSGKKHSGRTAIRERGRATCWTEVPAPWDSGTLAIARDVVVTRLPLAFDHEHYLQRLMAVPGDGLDQRWRLLQGHHIADQVRADRVPVYAKQLDGLQ